MQTFVNPKTPFLDSEGKPLANARVSFLSLDTNAEPIVVKNYDGTTELSNPMFTQSDGTLRDLPYVDDGVSYKVVVEKSTGVEPVEVLNEIVNASELYEQPPIYEFVVTANGSGSGEVVNATFVDGINGVRAANKSVGKVICLGYNAKDDGCPSRVFEWITTTTLPDDNGINVLRIADDYTGYWKMIDPDGVIDVRIGGIFPTLSKVDAAPKITSLNTALNSSGVKTLYFPSGDYYINDALVLESVIMENGCKFKPYGTASTDSKTVEIKHLENRGGKFCGSNSVTGARVVGKLYGEIHMDWFEYRLNYVDLSNVDVVYDYYGTIIFKKNISCNEASFTSITTEGDVNVNGGYGIYVHLADNTTTVKGDEITTTNLETSNATIGSANITSITSNVSFTGNPTFSGNPSFTGVPVFDNATISGTFNFGNGATIRGYNGLVSLGSGVYFGNKVNANFGVGSTRTFAMKASSNIDVSKHTTISNYYQDGDLLLIVNSGSSDITVTYGGEDGTTSTDKTFTLNKRQCVLMIKCDGFFHVMKGT